MSMKLNDFRFLVAALTGACVLHPAIGGAQIVETLGVRALGMGGAFVAVADDASAIFWNPAGLATGGFVSLLTEGGTWEVIPPDGRDGGAMSGFGTVVAFAVPPVGLGYYRIRASAVTTSAVEAEDRRQLTELGPAVTSLVTHNMAVTLVQSLTEGVTAAATVRFVRGVAATGPTHTGATRRDELEAVTNFVGRADNSIDLDVGGMASRGRVRLGIVARNLREPSFDAVPTGRIRLRRQVRAGVAVMPAADLSVALDVDMTRTETVTGSRRNVAVGVERWWMARRLGARAGVRANTRGAARPVVAGGLSVAARPSIWVEGQVTGGAGDADRGWSVGARIGF